MADDVTVIVTGTDIGPQGPIGTTPAITVTATTVAPGATATATITGSAISPLITFGIPKGDTGAMAGLASVADPLSYDTLNQQIGLIQSHIAITATQVAGTALTQTAVFGGDITGTIGATVLGPSGVTAGTYPKVAVDSKGRVTAGGSLTSTDIPTILPAQVSGTAAILTSGVTQTFSAGISSPSITSSTVTATTANISGTATVSTLNATSVNATVFRVGGINNTSANTPSSLVSRDTSGNAAFAALTATSFLGTNVGTAGAPITTAYATTVNATTVNATSIAATSISATSMTVTATATAPTDVTNKSYVDAAVQGLNVHDAVTVVSTTPITGTYTNGSTDSNGGTGIGATFVFTTQQIDGYTLAAEDRVLLKNQGDITAANAIQNGVYRVSATGATTTLTRATDSNNSLPGQVMPGDFVFVSAGSQYAKSGWVQTNNGTGTTPAKSIKLGTDQLSFTQFSGAGTYTASNGISIVSGNIITGSTASTTSVGVASFNNSNFTVSSGAVSGKAITLTAGSGISVSTTSVNLGDPVTITNAGVTSVNTNNTAQVIVSTTVGGVVLSTPQNIATNSTPTFSGITISNTATATNLVVSGNINGTSIPTNKTLVATTDIGVSVQAYSAGLAAISASSANATTGILKKTAADTWIVSTDYHEVYVAASTPDTTGYTSQDTGRLLINTSAGVTTTFKIDGGTA